MMKSIYVLGAAMLAVTGCASVPDRSPEDMARLPVVTFGEPVPKDTAFILHFPAGKPITTPVSISGNLFDRDARQDLTVTLRRDIYSYKKWVSFDRNTWVDSRDAIGLKVNIRLPGYNHPQNGYVRIEMDEKKTP